MNPIVQRRAASWLTILRPTIGIGSALLGILGILTTSTARAALIGDWTFETSLPATAGPFSPETGAGSATGSHAGASTYSNPAGNGSSHSFSSTLWAVGDYYQFQVSTLGLQNVAINWDQTSSGTGPRDFLLEYSTNGTTFTPFGSQYSLQVNGAPNPPWNATTSSSLYSMMDDLSGISALNNAASVYVRMVDNSTASANNGTVGTGGTDRVDNVVISGTPIVAVPEPSSIALAGSALASIGLAAARRRKTSR